MVNALSVLRVLVSLGALAISAAGQAQPTVTLNPPAPGASQLSGYAYNVDTTKIKVVIYALTNEFYVQPFVTAPFTNINPDGSWTSFTFPWSSLVILLVDPSNYTPAPTEITNPALDPGVLAWTYYPPGPVSVNFSGRTWGIKVTGNAPGDQFNPGPNFWSNDLSVVSVQPDGLHLKITQINGLWQCGEVYLTTSLGYGTYTVRVASRLNNLDTNTVAAPLFIYAAPGQELDNEYSGMGGLIPSSYNAQFVVQPYTVPGNLMQYTQPSTSQFTSQMEWAPDHVTFRAWNGWSTAPSPGDVIYEWTYNGSYIPPVGQERVHINLWLLNGNAPVSGTGDEMVINSFNFQPLPVKSDFNRDGHPDLVWQNNSAGGTVVWYLGGSQGNTYLSSNLLSGSTPGWAVIGTGDFNNDGIPDLVWQNSSTRQVVVWYMGGPLGNIYQSSAWLSGSVPGWTVASIADLNLDGVPDLIWQNDSTGQVVVWYMGGPQGSVYQASSWISGSVPGWTVVGTGDFNGDGQPDLLWQNNSTGQVVVWYLGGAQGSTYLGSNWLSGSVSGWAVVGAADLNLDGTPDVIWQNNGTGQVIVWYMGGPQGNIYVSSAALSGSEPGWVATMR